MIELFASALIASSNQSEVINKFCAYVVGIPYASDNFTDEEWNRFVYCRENLKLDRG
jgi:sarcosine oxidase delta subunit